MELRCGDKVLVRLDAYQGACRKLKNRWGSMLHMVVRRIADDVPTYVIENEKGKQKVLHHVRLLLWSSAGEGGRTSNDHRTTSIPSLHVGTGASTSW